MTILIFREELGWMTFPGKVIFSHIDFSPTYAIVSSMVMINNVRLFKVLLHFNIHCWVWPSQPLGVCHCEDLDRPLIGGWPWWPIEPASTDLEQASGLLLLNLTGSFSSQQIPALLNVSAFRLEDAEFRLEDAEFRHPCVVWRLQGWWLWTGSCPTKRCGVCGLLHFPFSYYGNGCAMIMKK